MQNFIELMMTSFLNIRTGIWLHCVQGSETETASEALGGGKYVSDQDLKGSWAIFRLAVELQLNSGTFRRG